MWRMRQLLKLLCKSPYTKQAGYFNRYEFSQDGLEENNFLYYLLSVHFLEDWRSRIHILLVQFKIKENATSEVEMNRVHKQMHRITNLIENCRNKGYLFPIPNRLKITYLGEKLNRSWGWVFLNEWFKEYPVWAVFFGSITIIGVGQSLFISLWKSIKPHLGI